MKIKKEIIACLTIIAFPLIAYNLMPLKIQSNTADQSYISEDEFKKLKARIANDISKIDAYYAINKQDKIKSIQWKAIMQSVVDTEY